MKKRNLFIILVCLFTISCEKEGEFVPDVPEYLVGKFKISKYIKVSNGISTNYFATMPSCVKDNIITYNRDYMVSLDEGATKCNSSDPQLVTAKFTIDGQKFTTYSGDKGNKLEEGIMIYGACICEEIEITFVGGSPGDSSIIRYKKQP
ncbi:MAG: hypothetical protein WKF85_10275 [Chitinophagaceae bacterium]